MTTVIEKPKQEKTPRISIDWNGFVREHLTKHWLLTAWLVVLSYLTITIVINRLNNALFTTVIILIVWAASVAVTVFSEVIHRHTHVTLWLKNNLYSSITNILLTLVISLGLVAVVIGLFNYAVTTASFINIPATDIRAETAPSAAGEFCFTVGKIDTDSGTLTQTWNECFPSSAYVPELSETDITAVSLGTEGAAFCFDTDRANEENGRVCFSSTDANPDLFRATYQFGGANWGAVMANLTTLMVFRFDRAQIWRVWAAGIFGLALAIASFVVYRDGFKNKRIRQALTYIWLASPIIFYILLAGIPAQQSNAFIGLVSGFVGGLASWAESLADRVSWLTFSAEGFEGLSSALDEFAQRVRENRILNIVIYGMVLLIAFGLWRLNIYVNFKYPPHIGEPEKVRMGRIIITLFAGIFAFFAFISVIAIVLLLFGAITNGNKQVFSRLNPDVDWGGFLLTLVITAFAIVVSFPLGILLALGRRSKITGIPGWVTYPVAVTIMVLGLIFSTPQMLEDARSTFEKIIAYWPIGVLLLAILFQKVWKGNVVSGFCTAYIEFIRGIPLITVLFLSIILFPIFLPPNMEILNTWRVMFAFALFAAAYLAENVRGGLQAIPQGQYEAADSLGLSTYNKYRLIIMPQALRTVIPAITNQYIGLFKDTTLVAIVGLLDILGVANAIGAQPQWLGVRREAYIYIALLYFIVSAVIAGYSARLEKQTGLGER
jgi:ABC-type amino acid transport system permease subunit